MYKIYTPKFPSKKTFHQQSPISNEMLNRAGKNNFSSWEHNLETKISCRPTEYFCAKSAGLKISFPGPSDKMSGDVEFGSDICPMTFSSVLTRK
jgi:hypothetical protein